MKFVKLTAIAAMTLSSASMAELVSLDDESLEEVSGQAGVTIEATLPTATIYYLDEDGEGARNGGAIQVDLEGVFVTGAGTATAAVDNTTDVVVQMDVDIVDTTPNSTDTALRIDTTFSANSYLHVGGLTMSTTGSTATTGNTAFQAALQDTTPTSGIGDLYVQLSDMTLYVYGH